MEPVSGRDSMHVDVRRRGLEPAAILGGDGRRLFGDDELDVSRQRRIEHDRPQIALEVIGEHLPDRREIEPRRERAARIRHEVHREPLPERLVVARRDDRRDEVLAPRPCARQLFEQRDHARDGVGLARIDRLRARARIEDPGLAQSRWCEAAQREHHLAAETVAGDRLDAADLVDHGAQISGTRREIMRRLALRRRTMATQIDEHHAPFGPLLDEPARDRAEISAGTEHAVREHEPARRFGPGDHFAMEARRHARIMPRDHRATEPRRDHSPLPAVDRAVSWHRVTVLADAGFDIAHELDTAAVAGQPGLEMLADPARRRGILVGNTRALWPRFLAARALDPELAAAANPIEHYTETTIARAFPGQRAWFSHRRYDGAFLPFQRLAVATGLGVAAPTQLVIHPIYGPWFALRAVIALAGDPPPPRPPLKPYTCTGSCEAALARATAATGPETWRAWLAVRDACTVGRAYRYGDDQIAYHYTKNRGLLR